MAKFLRSLKMGVKERPFLSASEAKLALTDLPEDLQMARPHAEDGPEFLSQGVKSF